MAYLILIASIGLILAIAAFFWSHYGPGSGRGFGNKIAKHNGIQQTTFWYLLDNGAKGSALDLLTSLEKSSADLDQASVKLAPTLHRGLARLEARFGHQSMYEDAKPMLARLMALSEQTADTPANPNAPR